LIIGASPVAQALGELAHHAGFAVHAAFPGADADMFPQAVQIIDGLELDELRCGVPPLVVVATQGKRDEPGLEVALNTGSGYIAFVASARKADKLRDQLKERGRDAAQVDAIISPAGIEIGAVTPEEIAVSVLAGLIQARRAAVAAPTEAPAKQQGSCCGGGAEPEQTTVAAATSCCGGGAVATTAVDPVCGMSVQIAGAEHVSSYQGTNYYFCCAGCQHSFDKDPQSYLAAQGA
jgi:xanthine dehydrogenase accessory factor